MVDKLKCRVCNSDLEYLETLYNKTQNVTTLYKNPFAGEKRNIDLYKCPSCTHMQIEWTNPPDYYDDYNLVDSSIENEDEGRYTNTYISHYCKLFKRLSEYAVSRERLLDIGCGPGVLMKYEKEFFSDVGGVEPSKDQCDIAKRRGQNVINAYFDRNLNLKKGYSAFVSTQVFEHITVFKEILEYACELLEDGGVGLVEVPNGQKMYKEQSYYDVFSDHVNYFTPLSLVSLANNTGFEVISVEETFGRNHLALFVRKSYGALKSLSSKIEDDKIALGRLLDENNNKRLSIWGVGAKSRSFVSLLQDRNSDIKHIWDVNSITWGKYLDGVEIPVSAPNQAEISDSDLILIFAAAFTEEIITELKQTYNYSGMIIRFDGEIKCLDI